MKLFLVSEVGVSHTLPIGNTSSLSFHASICLTIGTTLPRLTYMMLHLSEPHIMKWLAVICGAISVGCLSYIAYKKYRAWQDRREMLRAIEELRAARGKAK